ncbi:hypothetical protein [Streptomyces sp. CFMR 7]|uniref:hypothetical protein n=1 Tax=Streptomyces sp. CFMR 7 TaxID=1649184 RepID=UPI0011A28D3A|nr:hypothetical protein [Streptomyces sp. CFMR 7]
MGTREYQGAGGLRLHLDDPLSGEMAKQVARGHLVLIADTPPVKPEANGDASPALKRPGANAKVDDWRAYAVSLGLPEDDAVTATKQDCQDYIQVAEGQE